MLIMNPVLPSIHNNSSNIDLLITPPSDSSYTPLLNPYAFKHHKRNKNENTDLLPSPPQSWPCSLKSNMSTPALSLLSPVSPSTFLNDEDCDSDSCWCSPVSATTITPRVSTDHTLIDINLDPPSPLLLAHSNPSSALLLSLDDEDFEDLDDTAYPFSLSLALEKDPFVTDKFTPPPLLADPEDPLQSVVTTPVHETVEMLLQADYPQLDPASVQYEWHLQRLKRNRARLAVLGDTLATERRRRMSQRSATAVPNEEQRRFRARR